MTERRSELLAELFFQELGAAFISRPTSQDLGYNLLVGIPNIKKGINTFAVEVKGTEKDPGPRFALTRRNFDRLAHSNVPGILLVVDVKRSQLYYGWLRPNESQGRQSALVSLVELDGPGREAFEKQLRMADRGVAVAG